MDTFSVLTIQLARIYGIVVLTAALAALLSPKRMGLIFADFESSPGLTFMAALFALILGLVMVVVHNLWTDFAAIFVSLFGWIVLIKGILLLAAPDGLLLFATASASSTAASPPSTSPATSSSIHRRRSAALRAADSLRATMLDTEPPLKSE